MPTKKAHGLQIAKTCEKLGEKIDNVELWIPNRKNNITKSVFKFYDTNKTFSVKEIKLPFLRGYFSFFKKIQFWLRNIIFSLITIVKVSFCEDVEYVYTRDILLAFLFSVFLRKKVVFFEDHQPKQSFGFIYKYLLKKIDKKVVVSRNLFKEYKNSNIDPKSFTFIPNGVDLSEFGKNLNLEEYSQLKKTNKKIVLYVGHFYQRKGVYTLVDSSNFLNNNIQIFLIGGTTKYIKKLSKYIDQNSLNDKVALKGFLPHLQAINFMKIADVLVLPNEKCNEISLKYTTPLKMFEYMASGTPIVASDLESFDYYLENRENCLLFDPGNPESLSKQIKILLDNNKLSEKIAMNAKETAKKFTWENRTKKIIDFMNN